ncbi:MAG TPA: hypothetical protein VGM97_05370 [Steroidobacteraceae bacterium]|jgi:hypothetical protein
MQVFFCSRNQEQSEDGEMKNFKNRRSYPILCSLLAIASMFCERAARADEAPGLRNFFADWTPIADLRLRLEDVNQVPLQDAAKAITLRARLGFQTAKVWRTALLAEGNFLIPLDERYRSDPSVLSATQYPVVPDGRDHELNRLQLLNTAVPGTTIIFGRQRVQLDDQRFVGNIGWRQNEQTLDALRVVNRSFSGLTIDVTYADRVHRVYAEDSPQGTYTGSMFLGNIAYQTPIGKLTGFAYLLSFDPLSAFPGLSATAAAALNPVLTSTSTYGGRFSGDQTYGAVKIGYVASYATQQQRGGNPYMFENYYYLGELSASIGPVTGVVGDEVMQGNGTIGFATPLATTHAFDGWADKFLTTPPNGLENRYASLAYLCSAAGRFKSLSFKAIYRSFAPQHTAGDYGSEWDFQVSRKWGRFTPAIVLADYRAAASTPAAIARDTRKLFVLVDFSL